ncbi:endonuclease/exonuclease/phosphatase family protein [Pirellulimonas nuda]|nr:endonuclease/exonuclease/phosphatase family protein [Pirellulimonas nuda]
MRATSYTALLVPAGLLALLGSAAAPLLAAEKPPVDLRVMSFNIRYGAANDGENHWEKRKGLVADTIRTYDPDLLGTQETLGFQKEFLEHELPSYTGIGVGRDDGGPSGEMTAMFYKTDRFEPVAEGHFWLSETPEVPGSKSWDTSLTRMCSWVKLRDRRDLSLPPILWLNTHFDHVGKEAREQAAKLLVAKSGVLGAGCDVVITGDFNSAVSSPPYLALFAAREREGGPSLFIDTYVAARPDGEPGQATFNSFRGAVVEGARIDWIAVRGGWQTLHAAIDRTQPDGRNPSDHYPVQALLRREAQQ